MSPYEPTSFVILQAWVFCLAVITALLEIQIEGAHGWAAKLPTWRYGPRWVRKVLGGKDLTGYHVYLILLQLGFLHFPALFVGWSWAFELTVLACYFSYAILWDFLWFVLNPAFGLRRFSARHIWWFSRWIGPFPADYYFYLILSLSFATSRGFFREANGELPYLHVSQPLQHLAAWLLSLLAAATGILVISRVRSAGAVGTEEADDVPPPLPPVKEPEKVRLVADPVIDELAEEVAESERLQRAQWLIQFGELIFGIIIGLSINQVASAKLFDLGSPRSFGDTVSIAAPLLVLYCWIVAYVILYWYNMRLETPLFAIFIRQSSGVMHLVLVVILGFIIYQSLHVVTPDFTLLESNQILSRVDAVLRWLGIVIVFDLLAQSYLRSLWIKSCAKLQASDISWKELLPGIRNYYGVQFPAKTVGLLVAYFAVFFPGASFLPEILRYPVPTLLGWTDPLLIALAFVITNVACETYLGIKRESVHKVVSAYRLDARRRSRNRQATDSFLDDQHLMSNEEVAMMASRASNAPAQNGPSTREP